MFSSCSNMLFATNGGTATGFGLVEANRRPSDPQIR
jgi:hypothetical protein